MTLVKIPCRVLTNSSFTWCGVTIRTNYGYEPTQAHTTATTMLPFDQDKAIRTWITDFMPTGKTDQQLTVQLAFGDPSPEDPSRVCDNRQLKTGCFYSAMDHPFDYLFIQSGHRIRMKGVVRLAHNSFELA